jgi:hypothetical protein
MVYNFSPSNTQSTQTANYTYAREKIYTEFIRETYETLPVTPLESVFPSQEIDSRIIQYEQVFDSVPGLFHMVEPGMPDTIVSEEGGVKYKRTCSPIYWRETISFSHVDMVTKVQPGTANDSWAVADQISEKVRKEMFKHQLTWDVFRAMMLANGGLNYTDKKTGASARVQAHIPLNNMFQFDVSRGVDGRNEESLFRSIVDIDTPEPVAAGEGVPFTHPDAAISSVFEVISRYALKYCNARITKAFLSDDLNWVMSRSSEAQLAKNTGIIRVGAVTGDRSIYGANGAGGGLDPMYRQQGVYTFDSRGMIASINGIEFNNVETAFKDQDGVIRYVWPVNKIVLVAEENARGERDSVGRSILVPSEYAGSPRPGLWTHTTNDHQPPNAPAMLMQFGNAGMPIIKYPQRVFYLTVANVQAIHERLKLVGDIFRYTV